MGRAAGDSGTRPSCGTAEAEAEGARFLSAFRANWFGAEPATDEANRPLAVTSLSVRRRADWERLRDGLQARAFNSRH